MKNQTDGQWYSPEGSRATHEWLYFLQIVISGMFAFLIMFVLVARPSHPDWPIIDIVTLLMACLLVVYWYLVLYSIILYCRAGLPGLMAKITNPERVLFATILPAAFGAFATLGIEQHEALVVMHASVCSMQIFRVFCLISGVLFAVAAAIISINLHASD